MKGGRERGGYDWKWQLWQRCGNEDREKNKEGDEDLSEEGGGVVYYLCIYHLSYIHPKSHPLTCVLAQKLFLSYSSQVSGMYIYKYIYIICLVWTAGSSYILSLCDRPRDLHFKSRGLSHGEDWISYL